MNQPVGEEFPSPQEEVSPRLRGDRDPAKPDREGGSLARITRNLSHTSPLRLTLRP